jgi:hypothetical protein
MKRKRKPTGDRARSHRGEVETNILELDDATKFFPQSLGVDLVADDEGATIARVRRQLPDDVGEPLRIIVLINQVHDTVKADCARMAAELGAPVVIVDLTGRVLAFASPR